MSNYVSKLYKNAIKAEQEIVKASISDKPFNWYYGEYTEGNQKYDCLTDGHVLVAFTFNTFVLNKELFEARNKTSLNIAKALEENAKLSYEPAQLVGTKNVVGNKNPLQNSLRKDVYCVLQTKAGEKIFFNKKYQKYFTNNVEYRVHDSRTPIKIYDGGVFMGIIMPAVYIGKINE